MGDILAGVVELKRGKRCRERERETEKMGRGGELYRFSYYCIGSSTVLTVL